MTRLTREIVKTASAVAFGLLVGMTSFASDEPADESFAGLSIEDLMQVRDMTVEAAQDLIDVARQAILDAEAEAEAAAPPMPEPPPMMAAPGQPAMPSAEEVRARHEALKAMSPEERQAAIRADSEKRRAAAEAAMPAMAAPMHPSARSR